MCRLAAFPPGTSPDIAHELISEMLGCNDDGTGSAYVKDGSIVVNKYPFGYKDVVNQKKPLFDHMPFKGWTIAHVRQATHGGNEYRNTHPIIKGSYAVVHNGIFSQAGLLRVAMADSVKWQGETDSEVAAYMLNKLGVDKFYKEMPGGAGVYLGLHRDGSLVAAKLNGDLRAFKTEQETIILSSTFPWRGKKWDGSREIGCGVVKLDKDGHPTNFTFTKETEKKHSETQTTCTMPHGSVFTGRDIGFPKGMPFRPHEVTTQGTPAYQAYANRIASEKSDVTIIGKKPKDLSLWDWPTEEELAMYYVEDLT